VTHTLAGDPHRGVGDDVVREGWIERKHRRNEASGSAAYVDRCRPPKPEVLAAIGGWPRDGSVRPKD
jgi:hypothetical protein